MPGIFFFVPKIFKILENSARRNQVFFFFLKFLVNKVLFQRLAEENSQLLDKIIWFLSSNRELHHRKADAWLFQIRFEGLIRP